MQKNPLIAASIAVACVIVLASLTNVVGVQIIKTANHVAVKDEVDTKELLFQTIINIANDKEIQNIIQKYDERTSVGRLLHGNLLGRDTGIPGRELRSPPICTKAFLEFAYIIGTRLARIHDASLMRSILERYQASNQQLQREITASIENNSVLASELSELSDVHCDCGENNTMTWHFPILCIILYPIESVILILYYFSGVLFHYIPPFLQNLFDIIEYIVNTLNCFWTHG